MEIRALRKQLLQVMEVALNSGEAMPLHELHTMLSFIVN